MKFFASLFIFLGMIGYLLFGMQTEGYDSEAVADESELDRLAPMQASIPLPGRRMLAAAQAAIPEMLASVGETPVQVALNYLESNRQTWGIQAHHEIRPDIVGEGSEGPYRFSVYQGSYPVWGMKFEVKMGPEGEVESVQADYRPIPEADLSVPRLSNAEISEVLSAEYEVVTSVAPSVPVIFAPAGDSEAVPAIALTVKSGASPHPVQAIVRVSDGQVLDLTAPFAKESQLQ
jgi:hypothetical protein